MVLEDSVVEVVKTIELPEVPVFPETPENERVRETTDRHRTNPVYCLLRASKRFGWVQVACLHSQPVSS